jgi:hypothetical protein
MEVLPVAADMIFDKQDWDEPMNISPAKPSRGQARESRRPERRDSSRRCFLVIEQN